MENNKQILPLFHIVSSFGKKKFCSQITTFLILVLFTKTTYNLKQREHIITRRKKHLKMLIEDK